MSKIKTMVRLFYDNPERVRTALADNLSKMSISRVQSDKFYLKLQYRLIFNRKLDLKNPQTYNEKLQWLKLYDRRPEYSMLVDKYRVKKYVAERIGSEYVIPTLGVWDGFDEIDFSSLPDRFVLKCTHDSGGLIICRNAASLDKNAAREKIERSLKRDFYKLAREWPYKNVPRKIIAEQYMEDDATEELRDYKFFCFDGVPKAMFIATDRQKSGEEVKFDYFDMEYNHLSCRQRHPNAKVPPEKPSCFEEMKELAAKLSAGIPHVRVDFYEVNGKIYFGEMTFFHFGGMVPFEPEEWDDAFGSWLKLPTKVER